MYSKMAFNNVKKSFKDYTIYFLTLAFAVCIFYSFNSMESQSVMADMNKGQKDYVKIMGQMISFISVGVSFILGGLIIYATKFLISKRKKEFGIYMILGMSKRKMSKILFFETLYIGIISLIAGLLLGLLFAQVLSIFTAKLFALQMTKYSFVISTSAILKTILYFGIMYLLVMIFNVIIVSRYKLIDLLCADKKNEKVRIRNPYIAAFILILSIVALGCAYYLINKSGLDFYDNRFKASIALGIIGTAFFFYGIASVIFSIIQKNKNAYLCGLNIFNIRQASSKFNTNFISITVICLMLFVTIGTLASGLSIKNSMESSLKNKTPFDASLEVFESKDKKMISTVDTLKKLNYNLDDNAKYSVIRSYEYNMSAKNFLEKYAVTDDQKQAIGVKVFGKLNMIKISEFNELRELKGEASIELKDDEVLVSSNYDLLKEMLKDFVEKEDTIKIGDKAFKIKERKIQTEALSTSTYSDNIFALIVPDNLVNGLEPEGETLNLNFSDNNKEKAKEELTSILNKSMFDDNKDEKTDYIIYGFTREMVYDASRGLSSIVLFIAVYMGIVFLLASAAVLALQQLSQCNESIDRYRALRKIGATKSMVNKSIFKQVAVFFTLPLGLSIIHSYVGIKVVNNYLIAFGEANQLTSILVTSLIIVIIYGGYLYATYIAYKNVINSEYN
ncbi:FtsX-like permease family protein [Clostridium beijerinckii]|uniref:FtsX-like permease family protein n=1 Tax=Clostridium beijerinckii TaxID=1520 RepID=UPI00098C2596|nr:ABC transporter permease [Clostridium beijerinckii]MBA8933514.1 putative ABC transport system permease protein [Clostridium beijerinckii]NOW05536.1 putative ABC transport system permease protein [Clostridium beijerinckii]NRU37713.1 putative ABC transport system permease protein [Clostridium beijerinckii]NSA99009.1 putative ABC transport system permease protein [Clostridium beijerinckii]NYC01320.1 putative ABC transport system permease protein [Clostridium beijerinckii]